MLEVPEVEFIEMRCKNCEFCKKELYQDCGVCQSNKIRYEVYDNAIDDELIYSDAESYSATHTCGPNFGCVHFKLKEDN